MYAGSIWSTLFFMCGRGRSTLRVLGAARSSQMSSQMRRFEGIEGSSQQPYGAEGERSYKGVRRRRWGKWVSEIRVPGTRERLWLGSYATPEAAAVAYDTAVFYLKGPSSSPLLNFPSRVSPEAWHGMSPRSIQKAASDSGMAVDAYMVDRHRPETAEVAKGSRASVEQEDMDISVDDSDAYTCSGGGGGHY